MTTETDADTDVALFHGVFERAGRFAIHSSHALGQGLCDARASTFVMTGIPCGIANGAGRLLAQIARNVLSPNGAVEKMALASLLAGMRDCPLDDALDALGEIDIPALDQQGARQ